jgi:hypothetical protein
MQKITVYKIHDTDTLIQKITELRSQGKHPFSMAVLNGDADDWHGDPTYLLDPPIGYSTRSAQAVQPYMDQYHVIEVNDEDS